jgi:hypothetical protein
MSNLNQYIKKPIMERTKLKSIIVAMLFSVVMPASSTIIKDNSFNKNAIQIKWPKFINNVIDFAANSPLNPDELSRVNFADWLPDKYISPAAVAEYYSGKPLHATLASIESTKGKKKLHTSSNLPNTLLAAQNMCNNLLYEKVNFTKISHYFEAADYNVDTPNLRFWKSITHRQAWNNLVAENAMLPTNEPEPVPMALLGVGFISLASLQLRKKKSEV